MHATGGNVRDDHGQGAPARAAAPTSAVPGRFVEDQHGLVRLVAGLRSHSGVVSLYLRVRPCWRRELTALLDLVAIQAPLVARATRRSGVVLADLGHAIAAAAELAGEGAMVAAFTTFRPGAEPVVWSTRTAGSFGSHVSVDRRPRLLPLIELVQPSPLAGVVHAGRTAVDILELRAGHARHVARLGRGMDAGGAPRALDNAWLAGAVGPVAGRLVEQSGWSHLLAFGQPGLADVLAEHVAGATCLDVGPADEQAGIEDLRRYAAGVVETCVTDHASLLVHMAMRRAPRGAALGLGATESLLHARDVGTLLVARDAAGTGVEEQELEALARTALAEGADVVTVRGSAGQVLAGQGGVAALARGVVEAHAFAAGGGLLRRWQRTG
jgi:hypothetical protein